MRAPENGKGSASGKAGGKRRTRAQTGEASHAKRGAGLWRPEAAPCPRGGAHEVAGSRPFASPQEQADAGPSRALRLRGVQHAREALVFGHETAFWHETARPRGTPKTLNRRFADGTPHRQRERGTKGEFSCQNSVSWPKNNRFARTEKRGLLRSCRPSSKTATARQPRPSCKRRQMPTSINARRAQPRQSRGGPPPESARRRRARPSRRSARTPGTGRCRADRSPHDRRNRAAA